MRPTTSNLASDRYAVGLLLHVFFLFGTPFFTAAQALLFVQEPIGLNLSAGSVLYVEGGIRLGGGPVDGRLTGEGDLILGANRSGDWGQADWENHNALDSGWSQGGGRLVLASGRQRIGGTAASSLPRLTMMGTPGDSFRLGQTLHIRDSLVHTRAGVLDLHGQVLHVALPSSGAWLRSSSLAGVLAESHSTGLGYSTVVWEARADSSYVVPFVSATGPVPVRFQLPPGGARLVRWSTYGTPPDNRPLPLSDGGGPGSLDHWPDAVVDLYSGFAGGDHAASVVDRFWLADPGGPGIQAWLSWTAAEASGLVAGREDQLVAQAYRDSAWLVPGSGMSLFPAQRSVAFWLDPAGVLALTPGATPLPIACMHFSATAAEAGVLLQWRLGAGAMHHPLVLERSDQRSTQAEAEWVQVLPSAEAPITASGTWLDQPPAGPWLYRLRKAPLVGPPTTICPLRAVVRPAAEGNNDIAAYPSPFQRGFWLDPGQHFGSGAWSLYDPLGRLIGEGQVPTEPDHAWIPVRAGPSGLYLLVVQPNAARPVHVPLLRIHP